MKGENLIKKVKYMGACFFTYTSYGKISNIINELFGTNIDSLVTNEESDRVFTNEQLTKILLECNEMIISIKYDKENSNIILKLDCIDRNDKYKKFDDSYINFKNIAKIKIYLTKDNIYLFEKDIESEFYKIMERKYEEKIKSEKDDFINNLVQELIK